MPEIPTVDSHADQPKRYQIMYNSGAGAYYINEWTDDQLENWESSGYRTQEGHYTEFGLYNTKEELKIGLQELRGKTVFAVFEDSAAGDVFWSAEDNVSGNWRGSKYGHASLIGEFDTQEEAEILVRLSKEFFEREKGDYEKHIRLARDFSSELLERQNFRDRVLADQALKIHTEEFERQYGLHDAEILQCVTELKDLERARALFGSHPEVDEVITNLRTTLERARGHMSDEKWELFERMGILQSEINYLRRGIDFYREEQGVHQELNKLHKEILSRKEGEIKKLVDTLHQLQK